MKAFIKTSMKALLLVSLAACNTDQDKNNSAADTATMESDTTLMDTTMSTGTGTDTIEQKLKEGEDGTGKASTDPRTRKQQ